MFKRYVWVLLIVFASTTLVWSTVEASQEDTAQIQLKKTAISRKNLYSYTVKEGDVLINIIKSIPGMSEKDIPYTYRLIKDMNPHIPNIEDLEVGQSIFLPEKPMKMKNDRTNVKAPAAAPKTVSAGEFYYKVKRGDTLYKIIRREFKVSETSIPQVVRSIKVLNPTIKNVNKIYVGTMLKLPGKTVFVQSPDDLTPATRKPAISDTAEQYVQEDRIIEIKDKKMMPFEARLALLKQIITQMNGTVTTTGNYYLPIPQAGQVTIDCSKIPLIEFDDNTTVFLDLENRAHSNLKKMISNNWKNYHLVKISNTDDTITILKKVFSVTNKYSILKSDKPLTFGALPPAEVMVDWLIVKPIPGQQSKSVIQGLRQIYENNVLLPKSIKNYAQKNGLIITEFSEETGIADKPEELYSLPPIPVFPATNAKEFSHALVSHLGLSAEKDVEIQIFDTVKDGFNLSLKADVLVTKGNNKYVIYSQSLSQQFINALKQAGNETIFVSNSDSTKDIMGNVLSGLDIPFTYGTHAFSGLEKNQAPYALKFSGTRINPDLYVVNFDIDPGLRGLLQEVWSARIARY